MLARGADPDAQDTNGNTVLHLLVIYQKLVSIFQYFLVHKQRIYRKIIIILNVR